MSITGILTSTFHHPDFLPNQQNRFQSIKNEFQQLGQDLQAGNLTQAQQDFTTLTQNTPSGAQSNSPIAQDFSTLKQALQAGNLTAAQQAFSTLQQDLQQRSVGQAHHHHHHHQSGSGSQGSSSASGSSDPFAQDFTALGQALQAGNLTAAQQAYSTIQQDLQQFSPFGSSGSSSGSPTASSTVNVAA
jgi:soluble cytochrome b562